MIPIPASIRPGAYVLSVEAARETGGHELVTIPLTIPGMAGSASGDTELGAVTLAR